MRSEESAEAVQILLDVLLVVAVGLRHRVLLVLGVDRHEFSSRHQVEHHLLRGAHQQSQVLLEAVALLQSAQLGLRVEHVLVLADHFVVGRQRQVLSEVLQRFPEEFEVEDE